MLAFLAQPQVAAELPAPPGPVLTMVPTTTRKNVYIHPWHLDMSDAAKYGLNGKWPSNVAIRTHLPSVIQAGYQSEKESLEIKFPVDLHGKDLPLYCVQYIDGHAKGVMVQCIFALLEYCALSLNMPKNEKQSNDTLSCFPVAPCFA